MSEEKFRVIYDTSEETRIKELARMREKALHDEATYLKEAREEGKAEGRAEGRTEGIASAMESFAAKLRARGMSEEEIREFLE